MTPFTQKGSHNRIVLSPNGRYVAFDRDFDILLFDITRNATSSFVTRPGADFAPTFSFDGSRIAFASSRTPSGAVSAAANNPNAGNLYNRAVGAVEDNVLLIDNAGKTPTDWSRDDYLLYTALNDVWALPPPSSGRTQPLQVTNTPFIESAARFSPDGR